jgi:aspartyl-tRNA(Asn)/glutamyl-tRNA(Gln) amidotransferase subunit B
MGQNGSITHMETLYKGYKLTVGIEVHAELRTKTKMFCDSKNEPHASVPNTHVCPICMGHPGTLPVVNKEAVKHVLRVGVAVGGVLADYTEFDRKNYFYPDIPKGYQITQYLYPLVKGGELAGVKLTRVHLEEDTARSQHDQGDGSLIDYNRAGVPLMELVTEPVIHDAKTAGNFARELQLLLRTLGASTANMEKGEMRVEANISVSKTETFGTKVEVKNLNSFKSVEAAIDYEVKRQVELIEKGERIIQETRGWDENKMKTFAQRLKESADDYRYFPDPDIPKFQTSLSDTVSLSRIVELMPQLPGEKRLKYSNLGIPSEQIESIVSDLDTETFFSNYIQDVSSSDLVKLGANYLTSDIVSLLGEGRTMNSASPLHFKTLMSLLSEGAITSRVAKDILSEVVFDAKDARAIAEERGLLQESDSTALSELVLKIVRENPTVVAEYKSGKDASLQFLIGQGMKLSRGTANPAVLKELLVAEIRK